jgi:hypothetical protein
VLARRSSDVLSLEGSACYLMCNPSLLVIALVSLPVEIMLVSDVAEEPGLSLGSKSQHLAYGSAHLRTSHSGSHHALSSQSKYFSFSLERKNLKSLTSELLKN